MRPYITILLLFLAATQLQGRNQIASDINGKDTTFIPVSLNNATPLGKGILVVEVGQKATIYVNANAVKAEATNLAHDGLFKNDYQRVGRLIDSALAIQDTIAIEDRESFRWLYYLVSEELLKGNAKVYYKKERTYVDSIYHRLERYGEHAVRFFYLPDKRPFFERTEATGILDRYSQEHNHFLEYRREGEKLASLRKE